jgi:DNA-binding CsgD family transcriptional regulator
MRSLTGRSTVPAPSCCGVSGCAGNGGAPRPGPRWARRSRPSNCSARIRGPNGPGRNWRRAAGGGAAPAPTPGNALVGPGGNLAEAALAALTSQEAQIVRLAARGLSNRDIAARLILSPRTVGHHLYKAYPKLGVLSRGELPALFGTG